MNVRIETEAAQFHFLEYSNFRYTVFVFSDIKVLCEYQLLQFSHSRGLIWSKMGQKTSLKTFLKITVQKCC